MFMYMCMIPFMSIIYSKRSEKDSTEVKETTYWMMVSLILVHVKMIFDIHFCACASDAL